MKTTVNFMGEKNYVVNPLLTLQMIAASSIFGEKSYYRSETSSFISSLYKNDALSFDVESTVDVFSQAIKDSLDFDFKGTLTLAKALRNEFLMRKNPNIIFVQAALHKNRAEFNDKYPGFMREIGNAIINVPTDMEAQLSYYLAINDGKKNNLPVIVKRVWTDKLSTMSPYQVNKYKSGLIDLVRIADTKKIRKMNSSFETLLSSGSFSVKDEDKTWEQLSSSGKSWNEILSTIRVPHMALLRNLRNIFSENIQNAQEVCDQLVNGVKNGKQFPFRYNTAYEIIKASSINNKELVLKTLEKCIDISMENFPVLSGKTVCLSDNSGSAWGAFSSEYGSVTVATISNLSALMTAANSDEGTVVLFGDKTQEYKVEKTGILSQLTTINSKAREVGGGTEHGLWAFLSKAIKEKIFFDNIFIYSDQQAGHGRLYGIKIDKEDMLNRSSEYYDIIKMIKRYRKEVNKKVNVFSIQVAGYNNNVLPENLYRTTLLAGWTGKESLYAKEINNLWDAIDRDN